MIKINNLPEIDLHLFSSFYKEIEEIDLNKVYQKTDHIIRWEGYIKESYSIGLLNSLKKEFSHFQYIIPAEEFDENVDLQLYESLGGIIPILIFNHRRHFISVLKCLFGNKIHIPDNMGAAFIKNLKNKRKDTNEIILLSTIPYSNISHTKVKESMGEWNDHSLEIRKAHEGFHFLTQRLFRTSRKSLFDELLADYCGIKCTYGTYSSKLAELFLGLHHQTGRYRNYIDITKYYINDLAYKKSVLTQAILNIEVFDSFLGETKEIAKIRLIVLTLCAYSLFDLAQKAIVHKLITTYNQLNHRFIN